MNYNRLRCFGKLQDMSEDTSTRKILDFNINVKHPQSRSKKYGWMDDVNCDMVWTLHLTKDVAQDRNKWKNLIIWTSCKYEVSKP